jgi:deoxyribodipyrimidine photolyase-related protein
VYLPYTTYGAHKHFTAWLKNHLAHFGPYEDAMSTKHVFGHHSVLSPLMNIGLITPAEVVTSVLKHHNKQHTQSIEGFIRQVIGWREYTRFVYMNKHKELIGGNIYRHQRQLDRTWYNGTTGVVPIDHTIRKLVRYGWLHHIERLMVIGNFMLLYQVKPSAAYDWFMMFVDAYPWVMEPNVYGMSQFSAGPIMMGRPYFSSANYILKMSDWKCTLQSTQDTSWCDDWNTLYYYFIHCNANTLGRIYSWASAVATWKCKPTAEKKKIIARANLLLK